MPHTLQRRWYFPVFLVAALVLLPLSVLLLSWQSIDVQIWSHLLDTQMSRLLGNTLTLVLGVGVGVTVLGVSLAWLTSLCQFPGRRWLDWALMLPFAIPAYVLAFVFVGLLDFAGPVQTALREVFGPMRLPRVRSTGGVITVLVLVFYPYVYLLARSAFPQRQRVDGGGAGAWAVAATGVLACGAADGQARHRCRHRLGPDGDPGRFRRRGGVQLRHLHHGHLQDRYGFFSLSSAAQLASLLLLVVMLVLYGERRARGKSRHGNERPRGRRSITCVA